MERIIRLDDGKNFCTKLVLKGDYTEYDEIIIDLEGDTIDKDRRRERETD